MAFQSPVFEHLRTRWKFGEVSSGQTEIDFFVSFSFRNPLYNSAARILLSHMSAVTLEAFQKRFADISSLSPPRSPQADVSNKRMDV